MVLANSPKKEIKMIRKNCSYTHKCASSSSALKNYLELRRTTREDETLMCLKKYDCNRFPESIRDMIKGIGHYWSYRDQSSIEDRLFVRPYCLKTSRCPFFLFGDSTESIVLK